MSGVGDGSLPVGEDRSRIQHLLARALVERGFTAMKTGLDVSVLPVQGDGFLRRAVERIEALRNAVGDDVEIAWDAHGRSSPAMSIKLARAASTPHPSGAIADRYHQRAGRRLETRQTVMRTATSYFVTDARRPGVSPAGIAFRTSSPRL